MSLFNVQFFDSACIFCESICEMYEISVQYVGVFPVHFIDQTKGPLQFLTTTFH